jgi:hypothetical protein
MIVKKSCKMPKGGNQNPSVNRRKTENTKEKGEKDKQRSTQYTYTTKDQVTRTP